MVKKIVISRFNNVAAVLQNNKIQEVIVVNNTYQVNDIYLGVVHKIFSSINAAFVKLGQHGRSGFIHVSDTRPLKKSKHINQINEILSINQIILVQVIKEPTANKGPRLTANLHLYGKYVILMPFSSIISISHNIHDDRERMYLYALAVLIKPETMGLLIKSSAQGISEYAILEDLDSLKSQWIFIQKMIIAKFSPFLIYRDEDLIKKVIRDFYDDNVKKIIVDSQDSLIRVYYYLNKWKCISSSINAKLQLYESSICILDQFNITQAIQEALKPRVKLFFGGYLVIQSYEALTVIDVNSGSFNKSRNSKETILRTNFYAAIEIAYQLKIRNINGVIIVDFIDMHSQRDQLQLLEHFANLLKYDNAKPQIVQLSELGLVELTRRRKGQTLQETFGQSNLFNINIYRNFSRYNNFSSDFRFFANNSQKSFLIHKKIQALFFTKCFTRKIFLNSKKINIRNDKFKYFMCIDESNRINLFNPRANYLIPVFFYLRLIDMNKVLKNKNAS